MKLSFFGSSLVSSYWNGAATYYRGLLRGLADWGYEITFFEPDAFHRQVHRDIDDPGYARVVVYPASEAGLEAALADGLDADIVVKASGVGVFDDDLLRAVAFETPADSLRIFWDVDAPATLAEMAAAPDHLLRDVLDRFDLVFTYGGGAPATGRYHAFGARQCVPIYNGHDAATHFPVAPQKDFTADLAFLGNRLPDREDRVEEFFLVPARLMPERRFVLGGAGWEDKTLPDNVRYVGFVSTRQHNAFNSSPLAVLNIARQSMADLGYSPATRIFEAAGAGACIVSDAWPGMDLFFEPGNEILAARDGEDVARQLGGLDQERAARIGRAALDRVRRDHGYDRRALEVHRRIRALRCRRRTGSAGVTA